jgi:WD40 repeat protein/transcriptional regulator with XRE-family HTH domain
MKDFSYRERDYAFGQAMLTLRSASGVTQAGLADRLGISRQTVVGWEAGSSYPQPDHLRRFIEFCLQQGAFPAGHEAEEIHAFWKAAHQKVLLDEKWLEAILPNDPLSTEIAAPEPIAITGISNQTPARIPHLTRIDRVGIPTVSTLYGREAELGILARWILEEHCQVVSLLGMGGIGKSALAIRLMHQLADQFEVMIWRSLRDAPPFEAFIDDCLEALSPHPQGELPAELEGRFNLLVEYLDSRRTLLVFDNLEILLEDGVDTGRFCPGFEGYGKLLRRLAESEHQSCLLLTSREKPSDLIEYEGNLGPVHALRLAGLETSACKEILWERGVDGSAENLEKLVQWYGGNPLALKIVAETIVELFGGEIAPFLEQGEVVFSSVRALLDEQFARLSADEQTVLLWLAILREPVSIEEVLAALATPPSRAQVFDAVEALRRRSLIERGQRQGSFTLQSVVLEYATARLIDEAASEIEEGRLSRLIEHGLELAISKDYVRQTQQRLLVAPLLGQLRRRYQAREELEQRLLALLSRLRERADYAQGYGPANILALLLLLRGHLRSLDFSQLVLRGVDLQGVQMQDANLSGALLHEGFLTETFDAIFAVAISRSGRYWAAGSKQGEVRIWRKPDEILLRVWQAHPDIVMSLAFSPDERTLATGTLDGSLKLWDVERGTLLWSSWQKKGTACLAFAPNGRLLASGGRDATVRLWDSQLGTLVEEVPHPGPVFSLAWSPDGHRLVSGDYAGTIRIWQRQPSGPAGGMQTLEGHRNWVRGLAFAPDGSRLASASWDGTLKLWELESGRCLQTLEEHTGRVQTLAFSPDGDTLASGGWDTTIRLWDGQEGTLRAVLQGHSGIVYGLAFTPDSRRLLSGSDDGTLRLWDVESTQCTRVLKGYADSLYDLAWSPDGTKLASAGSQSVVSIWEAASARPFRVLAGHRLPVYGVAWSPDGTKLASAGWDSDIRLWDPTSGTCVQILRDSDHPDALFYSLAWSPDGQRLACGTYLHGVQVWNVAARAQRWVSGQLHTWIRRVAWSPDGTQLAGGGDDGHVYVWDASDGRLLQRLAGHHRGVTSVAWSPDGSRLASVGSGQGQADSGEMRVWDAHSGQIVHAFAGVPGVVSALSWAPSGALLVSADSDGQLRWWQMPSGECVRVEQAHQEMVWALKVSPDGRMLASCGEDGAIRLWDLESGNHVHTLRHDRPYERLNITGIQGLTQAEIVTLRALGAIEEAATESS